MHGHEARFLAGGEFPVPVPQSGAGGGAATITIQYKKFGVQLVFVPYILDGGTIRLSVDPEVSSIDNTLGIVLSGTSVPALNTRSAHTVVELQEGQTLAIAGLMQLQLNGNTNRIPGLGDLPYIGPFFSNTTAQRVEKELVVLVTPYLVDSMNFDEISSLPGDEVYEPNDLEFYLLAIWQAGPGHETSGPARMWMTRSISPGGGSSNTVLFADRMVFQNKGTRMSGIKLSSKLGGILLAAEMSLSVFAQDPPVRVGPNAPGSDQSASVPSGEPLGAGDIATG